MRNIDNMISKSNTKFIELQINNVVHVLSIEELIEFVDHMKDEMSNTLTDINSIRSRMPLDKRTLIRTSLNRLEARTLAWGIAKRTL